MTLKEAYDNLNEYYGADEDYHDYIQESWKLIRDHIEKVEGDK